MFSGNRIEREGKTDPPERRHTLILVRLDDAIPRAGETQRSVERLALQADFRKVERVFEQLADNACSSTRQFSGRI